MKEINLPSGNYLFIEIPDDAYDFKIEIDYLICRDDKTSIWNEGTPIKIPENCEIISTTKDITEEQAESIVDKPLIEKAFRPIGSTLTYPSNKVWNRYKYSEHFKEVVGTWMTDVCGAKESLQSLIQANELDVNKNFLILRKL